MNYVGLIHTCLKHSSQGRQDLASLYIVRVASLIRSRKVNASKHTVSIYLETRVLQYYTASCSSLQYHADLQIDVWADVGLHTQHNHSGLTKITHSCIHM